MARGWESKSVEAQQEEAARTKNEHARQMTPEESDQRQRRQTIELARRKAMGDLRRATTSAHRAMLERAIADLDEQLRNP
ncbi:MAG TPA: hypothetical protein VF332_01430 [Vicinamibacterales bacterium]